MFRERIAGFLATLAFSSLATSSFGAGIYWERSASSPSYVLERADFNGSNATVIYSETDRNARALFLDLAGRKLYRAAARTPGTQNAIQRMDLDGGNVEDFVPLGSAIPAHMAVDPPHNKVYWVQLTNIYRATLDGSGVQLIKTVAGIAGVAADRASGKVYWVFGQSGNTLIRRADSDGTNEESVLTINGVTPSSLGLWAAEGRLYWIQGSNIRAVNVDGTGLANVLTQSGFIFSLSVDEQADKLYFVTLLSPSTVWRANIDGTGVESLASASGSDVFAQAVAGDETLVPPVTPTLGAWGMFVLALLMLIGGSTIAIRRSPSSQAP